MTGYPQASEALQSSNVTRKLHRRTNSGRYDWFKVETRHARSMAENVRLPLSERLAWYAMSRATWQEGNPDGGMTCKTSLRELRGVFPDALDGLDDAAADRKLRRAVEKGRQEGRFLEQSSTKRLMLPVGVCHKGSQADD